MNLNVSIRPEPESQLGRQLAEIESLQIEAAAQQQIAAQFRSERTRLGTAQRRLSYTPRERHAAPDELETLSAELMQVADRAEHHTKVILLPILSRLGNLQHVFQRDYEEFVNAQKHVDMAARLGGTQR